ncbi:serine hydrolase domain-containing protein [Deminuibacter soli]|uniref:Class A beta-lactamase-related serine hydrolase n=1 Tax=Deminuibacter soli TaxID=2291815 RepID=A0A3E1NFF3_9BACT|nr:serine hydrolase domain-containing protein [Deminuibacter soli]RFM26534.1 class A beta-lactamase-related serine hydrolase [Deminuibacter soli]
MTQKPAFICMKVSLILLFLQLLQPAFSQYNFTQADALLQQHQQQLGNNVVALVYKNGKLVYQKEMGGFNSNTPARIASCSKWLTAALVMTFVEEGKLNLDDKVGKYLPIFDTYGKSYITVRQCLSHLSGIAADKPGLLSFIKISRYSTLEVEVNDFASKNEIEAKPGSAFRYSAVGLNIAGRILEVISKKPFDRLMTDRIFKPLGMKNSSFASEKAVNPSGGATSTAADYMNFLTMILNKGMFNGKRLLSEASIAEMQQSRTHGLSITYTPAAGEGFEYGYGEWVQEKDAAGNSTVVSSPGLFGTWPLVDMGRQYASIIFVKTLLNEQRKDVYLQLKQAFDAAMK